MINISAQAAANRSWSLLVGIDRVAEPTLQQLGAPAKDVSRLQDALCSVSGIALPSDHVSILSDPGGNPVDKSHFVAAIAALAQRTSPGDFIFIYFAGHGVSDLGQFYLMLSPSRLDDLGTTALSASELSQALGALGQCNVFFVLDCCRSAGFAEGAPDFFRVKGASAFRILLSSARADQPSWELADGSGTLFTRRFIDILSGAIPIGSVPGAIFFSDLNAELQNGLSEDLSKWHPGVPEQEPVFAGVFGRDPLLFVHRGLTLSTVKLKTARLSPAYVRRLLRRLAAGLAAVLLLGLGAFWTVLENSEFARSTESGVEIRRGLPSIAVGPYPRLVWEFPFGAEAVRPGSPLARVGGTLAAPLGRPVTPLLLDQLGPSSRAAVAYWDGDWKGAAEIIRRSGVRGLWDKPPMLADSLALLSTVGSERDVPLFRSAFDHPSADVRKQAIGGLLRFSRSEALDRIARIDVTADRGGVIQYALGELRAPCDGEIQSLFNRLVMLLYYEKVYVIDARATAKCGWLAGSWSYDIVEASDMAWLGWARGGEEFRAELLRKINVARRLNEPLWQDKTTSYSVPQDIWESNTAIRVLSDLPEGPCLEHGRELLRRMDELDRLVLALALARHCPSVRLEIRAPAADEVLFAHVLIRWLTGAPETMEIAKIRHQETGGTLMTFERGVEAMGRRDLLPLIDAVTRETEDEDARLSGLRAMRHLGARSKPYRAYLGDTDPLVQLELMEWSGEEDPSFAARSLGARFAEASTVLTGALGSLPLTERRLDLIRRELGSANKANVSRAAGILAMRAAPAEAASLLRDTRWTVRNSAAQFVAANPRFSTVLAELRRRRGTPDPVDRRLEGVRQDQQYLAADLRELPRAARLGRVRLKLDEIERHSMLFDGYYFWLRHLEAVLRRSQAPTYH